VLQSEYGEEDQQSVCCWC